MTGAMTTWPVSRVRVPALLVLVTFGGCATINSGPYGVPVDETNHPVAAPTHPVLAISAAEDASVASPYFGLVEVTFENNSPAWLQIDRVELDFGSPDRNRSVQIPWGDDIATWSDAVRYRNFVEQTNTQTALGVLALLGAVGRGAGRHGHGQAGAAVAAAGGLLEVASIGAALAVANQPEIDEGGVRFSGTHLLAMPIRVPPGLFTKRWILFYTAARPLGGCIDRVTLAYETSEHAKGRVALHFKATGSPWQAESCGWPGPGPSGM